MSDAPDVPCIDCGAPDGTPYLNGRCRDCDIDWLSDGLRCGECHEPTNVNDIALRLFGWHGYHLPTCSRYLPAEAPLTNAQLTEVIQREAAVFLSGSGLDIETASRELDEWVSSILAIPPVDTKIDPT